MFSRLIPAPLVRWFARPYVAGDSIDAALDTVQRCAERGLLTTLDLLGEDVKAQAQVQANIAAYERTIDALAADPRFHAQRPSVSLKPSAFTVGDRAAVVEPIAALAKRAHEKNVALTIDMEDRHWTDLTIDMSRELHGHGLDVGTVLQTRLNRTEKDLERIPEGMRLRLVIGIYPESDDVAVTEKRVMKERMVDYARILLDRGAFVEFATHDEVFIERFVRDVVPKGPDRCEVQMLLGVPRAALHEKLAAAGIPVRIYVPFALGWAEATAYLRRRMEESPSVMWLVLRNLLSKRARAG